MVVAPPGLTTATWRCVLARYSRTLTCRSNCGGDPTTSALGRPSLVVALLPRERTNTRAWLRREASIACHDSPSGRCQPAAVESARSENGGRPGLWPGLPTLFATRGDAPRRRRTTTSYLMILVTRPAPTVRPPSRMAKRRPSSMAIGLINSTVIWVLSPGMHISVPSGRLTVPVTSVVRK